MEWIGIDYGSKMAGTTVIAYPESGKVRLTQSEKKKDADRFLLQWVWAHRPAAVFLDAPLSLPGVYTQPEQYTDYFYREGDKAVSAMSPMFLGGLTARAMKLAAQLRDQGCQIYEAYPGRLARELELDRSRYKKDKAYMGPAASLLPLGLPLAALPANWHQFDALLAYCTGLRYSNGEHLSFGSPQEGQIIV